MERTTLNIPVIALRGLTVFPDLTLSFDVEREISIYALDNAMEGDRSIFLVTQREIATTAPTEQDLYTVGTKRTRFHFFSASCGKIYDANTVAAQPQPLPPA